MDINLQRNTHFMDIFFCKITHFMDINLQLNGIFFLIPQLQPDTQPDPVGGVPQGTSVPHTVGEEILPINGKKPVVQPQQRGEGEWFRIFRPRLDHKPIPAYLFPLQIGYDHFFCFRYPAVAEIPRPDDTRIQTDIGI